MDFNSGTPQSDGRYLCIVENDLQPSWALPVILTWRGQWLLPTSEKPHKWPIYGWIGPLPIGRLSKMFPEAFKDDLSKYAASAQKLSDAVDGDIIAPIEYDL